MHIVNGIETAKETDKHSMSQGDRKRERQRLRGRQGQRDRDRECMHGIVRKMVEGLLIKKTFW